MITESFARCLAKISGDGYLGKRYIRYANKCSILLDEFVRDVQREFPGTVITRGITNTGTPFRQIHGKRIIHSFLQHLPDFRSSVIKIPDEVKNSTREIKSAYLRAFYDDEGCAAVRIFRKTGEWKRNITLTSNSKTMLEDVKNMLLREFKIETNIIIRNNKKDRAYVLGISKKKNFSTFQEKIGFNHPNKQKRLSLMIESYGKTFSRSKNAYNKLLPQLEKLKKKMDLPAP